MTLATSAAVFSAVLVVVRVVISISGVIVFCDGPDIGVMLQCVNRFMLHCIIDFLATPEGFPATP
jgi:hypothetical protein